MVGDHSRVCDFYFDASAFRIYLHNNAFGFVKLTSMKRHTQNGPIDRQ